MRLTARDKDFILRCALAAHFTSPSTPADRPLTFREVKRLIDNGYLGSSPGGYRPTAKGAEVVAADFARLLPGKPVLR